MESWGTMCCGYFSMIIIGALIFVMVIVTLVDFFSLTISLEGGFRMVIYFYIFPVFILLLFLSLYPRGPVLVGSV